MLARALREVEPAPRPAYLNRWPLFRRMLRTDEVRDEVPQDAARVRDVDDRPVESVRIEALVTQDLLARLDVAPDDAVAELGVELHCPGVGPGCEGVELVVICGDQRSDVRGVQR